MQQRFIPEGSLYAVARMSEAMQIGLARPTSAHDVFIALSGLIAWAACGALAIGASAAGMPPFAARLVLACYAATSLLGLLCSFLLVAWMTAGLRGK